MCNPLVSRVCDCHCPECGCGNGTTPKPPLPQRSSATYSPLHIYYLRCALHARCAGQLTRRLHARHGKG